MNCDSFMALFVPGVISNYFGIVFRQSFETFLLMGFMSQTLVAVQLQTENKRLFYSLFFFRKLSNNQIKSVDDGAFDGLVNLYQM